MKSRWQDGQCPMLSPSSLAWAGRAGKWGWVKTLESCCLAEGGLWLPWNWSHTRVLLGPAQPVSGKSP